VSDRRAPEIDEVALAADVRRGDEVALGRAYRAVFGGPLGRLVLADFARACGVGARRGPGVTTEDRHYQAGMHDAALVIAAAAGVDQAALAVLAVTGKLEGSEDHDDGSSGRGGWSGGHALNDWDDLP
jgi:hypothetical protein